MYDTFEENKKAKKQTNKQKMDIGFVSLICCFDNLEHKVPKERERELNVVQFCESNEMKFFQLVYK